MVWNLHFWVNCNSYVLKAYWLVSVRHHCRPIETSYGFVPPNVSGSGLRSPQCSGLWISWDMVLPMRQCLWHVITTFFTQCYNEFTHTHNLFIAFWFTRRVKRSLQFVLRPTLCSKRNEVLNSADDENALWFNKCLCFRFSARSLADQLIELRPYCLTCRLLIGLLLVL